MVMKRQDGTRFTHLEWFEDEQCVYTHFRPHPDAIDSWVIRDYGLMVSRLGDSRLWLKNWSLL